MKKYKKILVLLSPIILIILFYTPFIYPSYWEFRELCKLNNYPKSEEKYNRILAYFDKSLDGSIGKNGYSKIGYSNRIDLGVYIDYNNSNNKLMLNNIDKIYFRPIWKNYTPNIYGNEGNMDFRLKFDGEIDCRSFIGELDG
ncbi:hypothetical protein CQA53_04850 [Helicobacter didelphidarum]|uniref:Uncharacterized protein n=1 Tax=Helicobacter didelphidarum TaxID=2040648 RepID=A0A3D8IMI3_9HELI|nr:hypothetical protein [Helicobacter didelphidarum]RDU66126.1 hypothetical protein CQA53_04850 [Helicobacter didelphidarum]